MTTKINAPAPAPAPSPSKVGAPFASDLVQHLADFTQTVSLDAPGGSRAPRLADVKSRAAQAAAEARTALETSVQGLAAAGKLPVETLLFMHELRAARFELRIERSSDAYLSIHAERNDQTSRIDVELDPRSQGYRVDGTPHAEAFNQIFSRMIRGKLIHNWQGDLPGGGSTWKSFEGTGVVA